MPASLETTQETSALHAVVEEELQFELLAKLRPKVFETLFPTSHTNFRPLPCDAFKSRPVPKSAVQLPLAFANCQEALNEQLSMSLHTCAVLNECDGSRYFQPPIMY